MIRKSLILFFVVAFLNTWVIPSEASFLNDIGQKILHPLKKTAEKKESPKSMILTIDKNAVKNGNYPNTQVENDKKKIEEAAALKLTTHQNENAIEKKSPSNHVKKAEKKITKVTAKKHIPKPPPNKTEPVLAKSPDKNKKFFTSERLKQTRQYGTLIAGTGLLGYGLGNQKDWATIGGSAVTGVALIDLTDLKNLKWGQIKYKLVAGGLSYLTGYLIGKETRKDESPSPNPAVITQTGNNDSGDGPGNPPPNAPPISIVGFRF